MGGGGEGATPGMTQSQHWSSPSPATTSGVSSGSYASTTPTGMHHQQVHDGGGYEGSEAPASPSKKYGDAAAAAERDPLRSLSAMSPNAHGVSSSSSKWRPPSVLPNNKTGSPSSGHGGRTSPVPYPTAHHLTNGRDDGGAPTTTAATAAVVGGSADMWAHHPAALYSAHYAPYAPAV